MDRHVLTAALIGAATTFVALGANAQSASEDAIKECEADVSKSAAYVYLTGKQGKKAWDKMATSGSSTLEIDKGAVEAKLPSDATDYTVTAFVSIPFSAVSVFARLLYAHVSDTTTQITVCHYALKSSAPSWGDFQMSDLKAINGRRLKKISSSTNVRLGGAEPPAGYRSSTVAVVFAYAFGDAPTVKVQLKSEKKK